MSASAITPPAAPLAFDPSLEHPEPDEAETERALIDTLMSISHTTKAHAGVALRSVHAKGHGVLQGELRVLDNLPDVMVQGVFQRLARYPVVIRLSTTPGDLLDDKVSTPRGMALKLMGVPGDRLAGAEEGADQDFVMVNAPVFSAATPAAFLSSLKLLAATTDRAPGLKKLASAALRAAETIVEAFGTKSPVLAGMGGQRETHILGESFFTQAPVRYGQYVAKLCVVPVSDELRQLTDAHVDLEGTPDGLRRSVVDFFAAHDAQWELRVQLCTSTDDMPIEDASVKWSEDLSPYVPVARIVVPAQPAWAPEAVNRVDEGMSFSPWHGVAAHQPLGGIMRVRRAAYLASARFRGAQGACPFHGSRATPNPDSSTTFLGDVK